MRNIHGIVLLNKPSGLSSNQALQRVKKIFDAKKAGHTGSLDVLASGLLPICLGDATKFSQYLLEADKHYLVTAKLGIRTTTGDLEGEIIEEKPVAKISLKHLEETLGQFFGEIQQVPPMFSALKYKGTPLYKLARQGIEIERQPRTVSIYNLSLTHWENDTLSLQIHCSKGTYVRTLVEDIGQALDCGAHVTELIRVGIGHYHASQMITIDTLCSLFEEGGHQALEDNTLLSTNSALAHLQALKLSDFDVQLLRQGKVVNVVSQSFVNPIRLLDSSGHFLGVGNVHYGKLVSQRLVAEDSSF